MVAVVFDLCCVTARSMACSRQIAVVPGISVDMRLFTYAGIIIDENRQIEPFWRHIYPAITWICGEPSITGGPDVDAWRGGTTDGGLASSGLCASASL